MSVNTFKHLYNMGKLKISKQISKNQIAKTMDLHDGFLLIELMVALLILIFFMYLMYRYHSMTIETKYEAIKRYEVTNLIHSFLAKVSYDPSLLSENHYKQDGCTLTWTLEDFPFKKTELLTLVTAKVRSLKIRAQWYGWHNKIHTMIVTSGIVV
jgi:Tfp pilus assembly protein PilV